MKTEIITVTLTPGYKMEVSKRFLKKAGLMRAQKLALDLTPEEREAVLATVIKDRKRKYSILMLDEAVGIMRQRGMKAAVRITGIHQSSIEHHMKTLLGPRTRDGNKYTHAIKKRCIDMAMQMLREKKARGAIPAFKAAGVALGINGYSVWHAWQRGHIQ